MELKIFELIKFSGRCAYDPYTVFNFGEVIAEKPVFSNWRGFAVPANGTDINQLKSVVNEFFKLLKEGNIKLVDVYAPLEEALLEALLDQAGIECWQVGNVFSFDEDVILIDPYRDSADEAILDDDDFIDDEDMYGNVKVWVNEENVCEWKTVAVLADGVVFDFGHGRKLHKVYSINKYIPKPNNKYLLVEYGPYIRAEFLSEDEKMKE